MAELASTAAQSRATVAQSPIRTWLILAGVVLLGLVVQLPRVADFEKFGFYDEGAWLHLVDLVTHGAVPAKDVGYSYGMLPLIASRAWFALVGRTPSAFIAFTMLCNLWTAWGFARIIAEVNPSQSKVKNQKSKILLLLAAVFLSYGIFPNNYSLMHPLEMALIVSALAQQPRGRYGFALVWATLAVFTKPTMGYVLGLVLLILAAAFRKGWKIIVPPAVAGLAAVALELLTVGPGPLLSNLLPITGGKSYTLMHFGIFRAGMSFWWPQQWSFWPLLHQYLLGPALFWITGTFFLWIMGALALRRLVLAARAAPSDPGRRHRDALLLTLAILHAVFVFALYAWAGSWTYYSYLVVLGLLVGLPEVPSADLRRVLMWSFLVIALLGLDERFGDGMARWMGMTRPPDAAGLWTYPEFFQEAQHARELADAAGPGKSLWLINGDLSDLWPEVHQPPCWFLSPGIPTPEEIAKTRTQIAASDVVVLCKFYDQTQEAWNWHEFADLTSQFEVAWEGKDKFLVLRRRAAPP